jgi:hypothetical protein
MCKPFGLHPDFEVIKRLRGRGTVRNNQFAAGSLIGFRYIRLGQLRSIVMRSHLLTRFAF